MGKVACVAVVLLTAGLLGAVALGWLHGSSRDVAVRLELRGAPDRVARAAIGALVEEVFEFDGGGVGAPSILWSSCECNLVSLDPPETPCDGAFQLRFGSRVPYDGGWSTASAVVGRRGWHVSQGTLVSLAAADDGSAFLVTSPEVVLVAGSDALSGEPIHVQFDVRLRSSSQIIDPLHSIAAVSEVGEAEFVQVVRTVEAHGSAFAGRLEMRIVPRTVPVRGGVLVLSLTAEPAVSCAVRVAIGAP